MQSGTQIYSQIKEARDEASSQTEYLNTQLHGTQCEINQAIDQRTTKLAQLAACFMDTETAGFLGGRLSQVTLMLNQMHAAKQQRRAQLEELTKTTQERREQINGQAQESRQQEIVEAEKLEKAIQACKAAIEADPKYQEITRTINTEEKILTQAKAALKMAEDTAKSQGQAYLKNPEFMYLKRRNWPQKRSLFPWIRMGDEFVAQRLNFTQQNARYERLQNRPKLIQDAITQGETKLKADQQALADQRQTLEDAHNIFGLKSTVDQRIKTNATFERQIKTLDTEIANLQGEIRDILQNRSSFEEALKTEIKDLLSRLNPAELIQATASTPNLNDDSIAQEIQALTDRIQQLKDRANSLTTQIVQAQATEQKYRDLLNKFEQADYHRSNSQFNSGFDLSSLLTGYIAGQMIDRIWNNIEQAQSWKRETYRPSSRYSDYAAGGHSSNSSLFDFGSSSSSMSHMSSSHSHDSWSTPSSSGGHDSWSTSDSV